MPGSQSALDAAGRDAELMLHLLVVMTIGAAIIWLAVIALSAYAARSRPLGETANHPPSPDETRRDRTPDSRLTRGLIVGGGVVFPLVTLTALLFYGLAPLPDILSLPPAGGPVIAVTGEQWWWRVRYLLPDGRGFDLANEVRLPVAERVEVQLQSADVIHSFWLPSIAGKLDMVPGRVNRIALEPTRTGMFRGACAEYCGTSHARMNFYGVVISKEEFDAWADQQLADAREPENPLAQRGREQFLQAGCGACHTIRGTDAVGQFGPDLTHLASRISLGAATLPMQVGDLQRWIQATRQVKPGVHMPSFTMLPPADVRAIATYLADLR